MARDKDGARLYEWQDEQGVNFRLVARDKVSGADTLPTSANEEIITFYSNRNLKDSTNFKFKNPSVAKSYETEPKETPQGEQRATNNKDLREKNYNLIEQIKTKRQALRQTNDENAQEQIKQEINALKKEFFINEQKLKLENAVGKENLNAEIILKTEKNNDHLIVDKLDSNEAQKLGFDEPDFVAQSVDANEIRHILQKHGKNSNNATHSKKPAVDENDIANYAKYTDSANERFNENNR